MTHHINLIEHQQEGELCLVEDAAGLSQHMNFKCSPACQCMIAEQQKILRQVPGKWQRHIYPVAAAFRRPRSLTCSILLMKVCGLAQRGVSTTYATIVGKVEAKASLIIAPDADHVNISICPGVSLTMYLGCGSLGFSQRLMTCQAVQAHQSTPCAPHADHLSPKEWWCVLCQ